MRFWRWWLLAITLAAAFNVFAQVRAFIYRSKQVIILHEIHAMLRELIAFEKSGPRIKDAARLLGDATRK